MSNIKLHDIRDVFSQRLVTLLRKRGLRRSKLADGMGLSRSAISKFLHQQPPTNILTYIKIADLLGVSIDYLVGRSDEPFPDDNDGDEISEFCRWLRRVNATQDDLQFLRDLLEFRLAKRSQP